MLDTYMFSLVIYSVVLIVYFIITSYFSVATSYKYKANMLIMNSSILALIIGIFYVVPIYVDVEEYIGDLGTYIYIAYVISGSIIPLLFNTIVLVTILIARVRKKRKRDRVDL